MAKKAGSSKKTWFCPLCKWTHPNDHTDCSSCNRPRATVVQHAKDERAAAAVIKQKKIDDAKAAADSKAKDAAAITPTASPAPANSPASPADASPHGTTVAALSLEEQRTKELLEEEAGIRDALAGLANNSSVYAAKMKVQHNDRLRECQHERTLLKPSEDRVKSFTTAVTTAEKKLEKAALNVQAAIAAANAAHEALDAATSEQGLATTELADRRRQLEEQKVAHIAEKSEHGSSRDESV